MTPDPIWNVKAAVVELIPAPTAAAAIRDLARRLRLSGFLVYEDGSDALSPPTPSA